MTWNDNLEPLVKKAAKSVAYQWPSTIDADDVEQTIWLRLCESPGSVESILGMDELARYRALVGVGHQIASEERTDYDYFKGSYRYSVKEVKDLLSDGVLSGDVDGFHEATIDLEAAIGEIAPQYAVAIANRYVDQLSTQGNTQYRDALSNGLTALTDAMNLSNKRRYSERDDGPGSRQSITNAQALAVAEHQYEGSYEDEGSSNGWR